MHPHQRHPQPRPGNRPQGRRGDRRPEPAGDRPQPRRADLRPGERRAEPGAGGHGRHEYGQNFLVDADVIGAFVDLAARTRGPIVEIGPGDGALTLPLGRLGRPLTGVEIDGRRADRLARRTGRGDIRIVHADFLHWRAPTTPHALVGNLPFHVTTPMLRRVLRSPDWTEAVLLVQWEVARRRAGVGGATLMTAQWWPWYDFALHRRVPAAAFRPRPGVDGGLLTLHRRSRPLVADRERGRYHDFTARVFTGRGRGIPRIAAAAARGNAPDGATGPGGASAPAVRRWMDQQGLPPTSLPRDLTAEQWADLYRLCCHGGVPQRPSGPRRPARGPEDGRSRRR